MRAAPWLGVDNIALRAQKSSKGMKKKSFLSPSPGVVFCVWRTERGSKLKLGLLKCNQSPAHACRHTTDRGRGVGCKGLADLRMFMRAGGAADGDGAHFGIRCRPSALLPPAMLCAEVSCSGCLPAVTGKEIDVLNLSLYPFFFSVKMVRVTMKRRYVLKNASIRLQVPPLRTPGCRGFLCFFLATE